MLNNILFLEDAVESTEVKPITIILLCILFGIVIAAWIFVYIKYLFIRKLRIRFLLPNGEVFAEKHLKRGEFTPDIKDSKAIPGYTFQGFYLNSDFDEEYIPFPMVDKNIKVYAKYVKEESGEVWEFN